MAVLPRSVPDVFHLFDIMSWELSKLNLKNYVGKTLGRRMGARVQDWGVGGVGQGSDGPATAFTYANGEIVFYDSRYDRTLFSLLVFSCYFPCCVGSGSFPANTLPPCLSG